jgi:O-antigen/teichoic acid export membrane protein
LTAYFLGLVVFLLVLSGGLTGALSAFMLGLAAQLATGFVLLRHVAVGLRWDGQVAATQWWFGVRSLPGRLSEFLFTGGGDAVVMSLALGAGDVGLYVVARSVLELTLLPAIAAALVIQGGAPFGSAPRTRHLVIGAGILTALGATVLAVAGPALIPFVFGREFIGSAAVLRVLIGAVPALFLIRVLVAWNAREGHPQRNSIAIGSGVPAELVLVPLAGKAFGLTGAALAFAAILWIQAGILVALHQGGRSRRVVPTPG